MPEKFVIGRQRGNPKLIRHTGDVIMDFVVKVWDTATSAFVENTIPLYLGCLMDNWEVRPELETEDLPFSCQQGMFTIGKDKSYTVAVSTRNLNAYGRAALLGHKIYEGVVTGQKILVQKELTVSLAATSSSIPLDTAGYLGTALVAGDIKNVISLYQKVGGFWWTEVSATPLNANREFNFDGTNPDIKFEAALSATDATEFILTIQYEVAMAAGDVKTVEDMLTYPKGVDIRLSWLTTIEDGPDAGKKGYLIMELKNCMPITLPTLGGAVKDMHSDTMEFKVNFRDEGDIVQHFRVLS